MPEAHNYFGMYRARVVDSKDPEKFGRVLVWIPDIMPLISPEQGIWARPANNPIGGRNQEGSDSPYYSGTCYIPPKNSWCWIFFEAGNPNRPYYFAALDLENTQVLPESQLGENYEKKWVIFKSHDGRTVIISDDPDDSRVEITGKKRQLSNPPSGDTGSVYTIDGNQTTILLDERSGKEKILIRTHKGDYLNIDVETQQLNAYFKSDILLKSDGNIKLDSFATIDIKASNGINVDAGTSLNLKGGSDINIQSAGIINELGGAIVRIHGTRTMIQSGAGGAGSASSAEPTGERG